ncbi:MAG: methionine--tRNA ligase [Chloroflexi bacterium]|nr:methionine--tRNA ligase [Chloroflexota bacterium]
MTQRIFIGVAWPYANGPLHLGHVAGCYLPADIFARFCRLRGDQVLMVSGSDQHGTPITVRAEQEGISPQDVVDRYHASFLASWQQLGISFDLFTATGTANHRQVTHEIFTRLLEQGDIYPGRTTQPYCTTDRRFLPDRYVLGTCPYCAYAGARGDQCDECGKPLNASELQQVRCSLCGSQPEFRETEHLFLRLSGYERRLAEWVVGQDHWRPNVLNFTRRYLADGLRDRAITRDIAWGVDVPVAGFEAKRIYVWFEAVIGYLSASKEWAARQGDPEAWRPFWQEPCHSYYFIGKDNIPFHTIIWPAMLMGYGDLLLPYDVPANEFLTLEGRQLSTSRNWAVWVPDYLERYDPDPLRYLLSANMPETSDADFSWREFVRRNNDELVATYGNLVHRVLTFTARHFDGRVPEAGALDGRSQALLERARGTFAQVDGQLGACHFREALRTIFALAEESNRYLDEQAPWKTIKTQRDQAGKTMFTTLCVLSALKTLLLPFLPFSSSRLHEMLGFTTPVANERWAYHPPTPGQPLPPPVALFTKLDDSVVEQETLRLG